MFSFVFSVGRKKRHSAGSQNSEYFGEDSSGVYVCLDANLCMWKMMKATLVAKQHTHMQKQGPKNI